MQPLNRHHHFRFDEIDSNNRLAKLEAAVTQHLSRTKIADADRESSIAFEQKHSAGVTQFGRILARKRELDVELAAAGALLHDIYVIVTGKYNDHARQGGPIASQFLDNSGTFTAAEKAIIDKIVINHSDKDINTDDPYIELGKDADVLDCFQYPDALEEYLLVKPLAKVKYYFARGQALWTELGIPIPDSFHMLDTYQGVDWLTCTSTVSLEGASELLAAAASNAAMHPFAIKNTSNGRYQIYSSKVGGELIIPAGMNENSSAMGRVRQIQESETMLVWPGLDRYHVINEQTVTQMSIVHRQK